MEYSAREYVRHTGRYQVGELVALREEVLDPSRGLDPVMEILYGPLIDKTMILLIYELLYKRSDITDKQLENGFPWYVCRRLSVRPLEEYFQEFNRLAEITAGFRNKQYDYHIPNMRIIHGIFGFKQLRLAKMVEKVQYYEKREMLDEDVKKYLGQEEGNART